MCFPPYKHRTILEMLPNLMKVMFNNGGRLEAEAEAAALAKASSNARKLKAAAMLAVAKITRKDVQYTKSLWATHTLTLSRAPYGLYGVKCIGLVSLAHFSASGQLVTP